jgi:hypothetical protein
MSRRRTCSGVGEIAYSVVEPREWRASAATPENILSCLEPRDRRDRRGVLNLQQLEAFFHRLIMPCPKALVSLPMHSFGLGGKRITDAKVTAQALSHFLRL